MSLPFIGTQVNIIQQMYDSIKEARIRIIMLNVNTMAVYMVIDIFVSVNGFKYVISEHITYVI